EMLFYCQLRNKDVAGVAGVSENQVALCKHRCLNEIRSLLASDPLVRESSTGQEPLVREPLPLVRESFLAPPSPGRESFLAPPSPGRESLLAPGSSHGEPIPLSDALL